MMNNFYMYWYLVLGFPQSVLSELRSMLHDLTCRLLIIAFGATLKIHKKFKLYWNQLKISTQHKNKYMYQKKL